MDVLHYDPNHYTIYVVHYLVSGDHGVLIQCIHYALDPCTAVQHHYG
jgi:hypothetical protein